jgi:hypothetical protein
MDVNRRSFISDLPLLGLTAALIPGVVSASSSDSTAKRSHPGVPKTSADQLALYRKITASVIDGKETITTFSGITYGVSNELSVRPLHGVDVAIFTRTMAAESGSVRFMSNIVGVYSDLETNKVLDEWVNPYTGKRLKVWHQVNGPTNFELSPNQPMGGLLNAATNSDSAGFQLPFSVADQALVLSTHFATDRKNPMQPADWPLESSGERLRTAEFNQWVVPLTELADKDSTELSYTGIWFSVRPWRPFMHMGSAPGFLLTPKQVSRCPSIDDVDPRILSFGKKNFPELLGAPKVWGDKYKTNWDYYKERNGGG